MIGIQEMLFEDDVPTVKEPAYLYTKTERSWPPRGAALMRDEYDIRPEVGASPGVPLPNSQRFHTWGEDLKPETEGLTAEEYEFLASLDSVGGFV